MWGHFFTDVKIPCHVSFFVYTLYRFVDFSQKLNMTFQDFHNMRSGHNVTVELFIYGLFQEKRKEKNFGFHRNQCKNADDLG